MRKTKVIDFLQTLILPPNSGENLNSKSPKFGGFRGHSRIYARNLHELSLMNLAMKMDFQDRSNVWHLT
jgi:hypothetical protein